VRAFDRPSRLALLPHLVPKEEVVNAVALGNTIRQLNRLLGPATAGMLIYFVDVGLTYGACFIASLTATLLWTLIRPDSPTASRSEGGLWRPMLDGLNFIRTHEIFYTLIAMTFFNSVWACLTAP